MQTLRCVCVVWLALAGCDSGGGGGGGADAGASAAVSVSAELRTYEAAVDDVYAGLQDVIERGDEIRALIEPGEEGIEDADELIDAYAMALTSWRGSLEAWEAAEAALLEAGVESSESALQQPLTFLGAVGIGLAVKGLFEFYEFLNEKSEAQQEKRTEWFAEDYGTEAGLAAHREMKDIGDEVIRETSVRVMTAAVKVPVPVGGVAGLVLEDAAGDALRDGLKVVTATTVCNDGLFTEGCVLGATKTDADGRADVPVGEISGRVSGEGVAPRAA